MTPMRSLVGFLPFEDDEPQPTPSDIDTAGSEGLPMTDTGASPASSTMGITMAEQDIHRGTDDARTAAWVVSWVDRMPPAVGLLLLCLPLSVFPAILLPPIGHLIADIGFIFLCDVSLVARSVPMCSRMCLY